MPHKSGAKSYPATKGHPAKGMHKMPGGKMMSDAQMKKMMGGKKGK